MTTQATEQTYRQIPDHQSAETGMATKTIKASDLRIGDVLVGEGYKPGGSEITSITRFESGDICVYFHPYDGDEYIDGDANVEIAERS
jgi:hypothetical protein